MRRKLIFSPQAGALHNTEPVLLIDYYQPEIAELYPVLYHGMGAYKYMKRAVEKLPVDFATCFGLCRDC